MARNDAAKVRENITKKYGPKVMTLAEECRGIRHSLNEFGWLSNGRMDNADRQILASLATRLEALEARLETVTLK